MLDNYVIIIRMHSDTGSPLGPLPASYKKLQTRLAQPGWICQGTVVCRPLHRKIGGQWVEKGPYYLWTCKYQGKTVSHALSKTQYQVAKKAIEANRKVMGVLAKLQTMTIQTILRQVPGVRKRQQLQATKVTH
jgi:hypothetical protein